jgi:hypothetical protein
MSPPFTVTRKACDDDRTCDAMSLDQCARRLRETTVSEAEKTGSSRGRKRSDRRSAATINIVLAK